MRIHHIAAATMCPIAGPLVNARRELVCHCLVVELADCLALVETGIGLADCADPLRLGRGAAFAARFRCDPEETAIRQVERLGFSGRDVRHIVVTHLDIDHAGGLPDFPHATIHVHANELTAAEARASWFERHRYQPLHWAHQPTWEAYEETGEPWFGFEAVRQLRGLPPEILLVPLHGHSRGHSAVAVDGGDGWRLHCGDAYFFAGEMDPVRPHCSLGLRVFQRITEMDRRLRLRNQERLRELVRAHGEEVSVFCAHDPDELDRARARGA